MSPVTPALVAPSAPRCGSGSDFGGSNSQLSFHRARAVSEVNAATTATKGFPEPKARLASPAMLAPGATTEGPAPAALQVPTASMVRRARSASEGRWGLPVSPARRATQVCADLQVSLARPARRELPVAMVCLDRTAAVVFRELPESKASAARVVAQGCLAQLGCPALQVCVT